MLSKQLRPLHYNGRVKYYVPNPPKNLLPFSVVAYFWLEELGLSFIVYSLWTITLAIISWNINSLKSFLHLQCALFFIFIDYSAVLEKKFREVSSIWRNKNEMIIVAQLCNFSYLCYMKRRITTYGGYFERFIETLSTKELLKLHYIISLLETEDRMPVKFIKFIRDGLYELRMEYNSNIYRVFFIFDNDQIVVLFNLPHSYQE